MSRVVLVAEDRDLVVVAASANAPQLIGVSHDELVGGGLGSAFAPSAEKQLRDALAAPALDDLNPLELTSRSGTRFDAWLERREGCIVLEIEPVAQRVAFGRLQRSIAALQRATRPLDVARIAAEEIRDIIGFDRVAIYRVRGDALELAAAMPATAPPAEPVELCRGETLQLVADRLAPPVAVIGKAPAFATPAVVEAPGASLAVALGDWGIIVAEHPEPRHVSMSACAAVRVLARLVAWHLGIREQLGDELRASNMAKDEFLATVSHELRTPLNAMLGWLRLVEAGHVAPEREAQAIATVTRNANVLAGLVEELLDVSRAISGKLRVELHPLMPATVVEAALATVQPTAEAKGITIRSNLDTGAGPVLADASRLQQIVWNLLTNAVKFTRAQGTIDVEVRRAAASIEIVVADSGAGIDAALLPFVFERFRQGEDATTRAHGLGLGLSIVRHLVELHGGDVTAASAGKGQGATFTVRLPLATGRHATPPAAPPAPPAFEPAPQLAGLRVLAVDDEHDANDLIRAVLQTSGVEVTTASSADEVLSLLPSVDPHVLISDIGMPEIDGYGLIQEVRKLPAQRGGRVPAIAITAFARSQDRSRAFLAGFDVFLAKPVDPGELVAVLCNLAGRRATEGTTQRGRTEPPVAGGVLGGTKILIVDDDYDNADMLGELLMSAGAVIDRAYSAAEGMEHIRSFKPDVLVSDIGLPDKDGFAFVRELRATGSEEGGWIPAIALSGHAEPEHAREAILAGFQLHVAKPIDPQDLIARLARLVGRTARRT